MPAFATCIQHSIGSSSQDHQARKINKRHPNQEERSEMISVHIRHDLIYRKPQGLHTRTHSQNKQIQQSCRIQNQHTKNQLFFCALTRNNLKRNYENNFMGIPWWSSGQDSSLSLPRVRVQSLVGELRSREPRGQKKKKKKISFTIASKRIKNLVSLTNNKSRYLTTCEFQNMIPNY